MPRVLVTGGCGFIGSHLVDLLLDEHYEVRVLDNLTPQVHTQSMYKYGPDHYKRYADVDYRIGDVRNNIVITRALHNIDIVIHLAAQVGVGQGQYEICDYVKQNCLGTAVLLEDIARPTSSVQQLIVASSMSIYGEGATGIVNQPIPTPESHHIRPASIYAVTKRDQEDLCMTFGRAHEIPTTALRLFNTYGSRQSLSNPYTGVAAIFASRILNGQPPIVYEDGSQLRDFVHVRDVARGFLAAIKCSANDVYNIGSGDPKSVKYVADYLCAAMDTSGELEPEITNTYRKGDVKHCFADITKAEIELGYEPQVPFEQGMTELVEWVERNKATAVDKVDQAQEELSKHGLLK